MIETGIVSKVKIGDILSNQLPEFVQDESPLAVDFLKQYYISQEFQGSSGDLIDNLDQYLNVDNLTPEVIVDSSTTVGVTTTGAEIINVTSTKGFPNHYGLLQIDGEIITYTDSTPNSFIGCKRGFSGITSYHSDTNKEDLVFNSSVASEHTSSSTVKNLSSLFLKEFYKKFKKTFLPGLEETNLQSNLDVGTFIKEAKSLYQTKGTEESFRILFNILYGITPSILNLEERLIKPSSANYVRRRVCVAELLEGNPRKLKGQSLLKGLAGQTLFRSDLDIDVNASISEIEPFERKDSGLSGITTYYKIGLFVGYDESSDIAGDFVVVPNTKAIEKIEPGSGVVTVDSTVGFGTAGTIISGTNTISYTDKTVNQFLNCTGIGDTINPIQNVRSNITYFGFEDGDLDRKVVLRLTGVLSEFEQTNNLDVNEGEIITVKNIGDKIENNKLSFKEIFCNSWIYNTSSSYFIIGKDDSGITLGGTIDRSSLKEGDIVEIVLRGTNTVVEVNNTIFVTEIDGNEITLSDNNIIPDLVTEEDKSKYKLRKKLNKPSSSNTPIEFGNNVLISDVQNIYTDNDVAYVASNSLPSSTINPDQSNPFFYQITESTKNLSVGFGTETSAASGIATITDLVEDKGTSIKFPVDVPFETGDKIFYSSQGGSLVGLETGSYFVKRLDTKTIKLYGSPSGIQNDRNLLFTKNSDTSIHNFILFSQRSNEIGAQKLFKKFNLSENIVNGDDDITPVGGTGMLINGVEITNYKSEDKIFFGPLSSVKLLNGGQNYDVISLPNVTVSSSSGTTALVQPVISGVVEDVLVDPQDFDIDKVVSIGITGGNGTGCVLEPVIGTRFRKAFFKTAPKSGSGSGINTVSETITFIGDHNFADGESVIYDSNSYEPIKIVGVGTDRLVNGSIYYVGKDNDTTIRLFETFENYEAGTPKINFKENTGLGNHVFKVGLKKSLLDVNVIESGNNYTNRKLFVKPSGISTSSDLINFNNHGFNDGDLIEYEGNIVGLNTNNKYFILKNDDNSFNLSDGGVDGKNTSNFNRREVVSLETVGSGFQKFKFPDIKVFINFDTLGSGTTIPSQTPKTIVATPKVKGTIQDVYLYESGTGYGSTILNNHRRPIISLTTGKGASLKPIIENGEISDVNIENKGSEYFSTPDLIVDDPTGLGIGAQLRPIIVNQKLEDVVIINAGIGYSTSTSIKVKSSGINGLLDSDVRSLTINKNSDENNSQNLEESENKLKFSHVGYSTNIFKDDGKSISGLIGWAYDGNPIYGPFGFADPSNLPSTNTGLKRLESGYELKPSNIVDRPNFENGYFVEDYVFTNNGDLDEHNGRFEKTVDFPQGRYVYHATVVGTSNTSSFPYFIGATYRSKKIDHNFNNIQQNKFNFNQGNILRNTFPYKVSDDFANNDFLVETNEINDQQIEITSVSSGSITGFDILNSGSDYKVGELLKFDNTGTGGSNLTASISQINGKPISNLNTTIEKIQDVVITWSENIITASIPDDHDLKTGDIVNITGLTTDLSNLNGQYKIGIDEFSTVAISTINGSPSAGLTTEIFVSNIPSNISAGSSIGIGTETLKILNIYSDLNILTVERSSDTSHATTHQKGSTINYLTDLFTINKSIPKFESQADKKIFFNPNQTVGVGTFDGTEHSVTFDFAGKNITRNTPVKQITLENHSLKNNQKILFNKPVGGNIAISTDNNPATTFNIPTTVYAVNKSKDAIGIKTGLGANFDEVYFISLTNGDSDKFFFETDFEQVKCDVEKINTTLSISTSHGLDTGDKINLEVNPQLSVGIGTSIAVKLVRDTLTGFILINPIEFNSTGINTNSNSINISDHQLTTGNKIKYTANSLPDGLFNKNYFVYKVDNDNIKLCETFIDATKNIPNVVDISSTGGSSQTISKINPEIHSIKNNNLTFDLSDSTLSGYEFKLFYDEQFKNEFISDGNTDNFNVVRVGSGLTIGFSTSLPEFLYYNLEKTGFISTSDVDVKNGSKIKFIDSAYIGSHNITKINDTSFSFFLKQKPEKMSYLPAECAVLKYDSSSKNISGGISEINITSGGSNYSKLPDFIGMEQNSIGKDAVIIPKSETIGFVESVRIINEGFEYSSDKTLEPESLISPTIEIENSQTLGIVSVTNGGSDFITAPNLIIINPDTGEEINSGFLEPVMLENSILSVNINEVPIGLPESTVQLRSVNNTNGITILEVKSNAGTSYTCKLATPQPQFASNPFAVNDRVFIEGIEKVSGIGSGFNSKDYGYKLLRVSAFDPNVSGFAEVTIDVSEFGTTNTGIAKTVVSTFANIVNDIDYPKFFVTQNQSQFRKGEELNIFRNNKLQSGKFEIIRSSIGNLKVFTKENLFVGDRVVGKISGSQADISKVKNNKARLKTDFSILKDVGWNDNVGKLSEDFQVIPDNDYYQNMSYSIQSPIEWRNLRTSVNNILHTSGMKNFADTGITSTTNASIGSTENISITLDLFGEKRVDELRNIDTVKDDEVLSDNTTRKISFDNIKLSNFISCNSNDVLVIDNINPQFSNLEGNPNKFLDLFQFGAPQVFKNILVRVSSVSNTVNRVQLVDFILVSNGTNNTLIEKSNLINSGIGLTNSESNNFATFKLNKDSVTELNTFRFEPTSDPNLDVDYDLKIFTSEFNTNNDSNGAQLVGPIFLNSRVATCPANGTTLVALYNLSHSGLFYESNYSSIHAIDTVDNSMNFIQAFVANSGDNTFTAQAYTDIDPSNQSLDQIGVVTSFIANIGSDPHMYVTFKNNSSNPVKVKSKNVGFGTVGLANGTYRFKAQNQSDGSERTSIYAGITSTNTGISTFLDLNSQLFDTVKSLVEVSIGASKAVHEILALHDGTDAYIQQSQILSVTKDSNTEYDPSVGLGTFSATRTLNNFKLEFHPDNSSGISTVVAFNHCFYTSLDKLNDPQPLIFGPIFEDNEFKEYNAIEGDRVNKTEFTLTNNNVPIFSKNFNPSVSSDVDLSTGKFTISNHFFRENEELIYTPRSTFIGIGSTPMQFKNGSIIDTLPTTVFAKTVTKDAFFISTTRSGTAVTFTGVGDGNAHEFVMSKRNEKALISIDDTAQYPLIRTDVTHTLENNVGSQVGLTTTIINLSGISTISINDILKIDDELVRVTNVGIATTNGSPVGTSGTFGLVEVDRGFVGTNNDTHSDGSTVERFKGNYNIVGSKVFFTDPPRGNPNTDKDESNLDTPRSQFNGRVYLRNDYGTNQIYDDISDQFTGINSTFTLKVGGANTVGLGTTGGSGILFVNGVFQSPSTVNNPDKNFKILETGSGVSGVSSVFFTGITSDDGSPFISNNNINLNELPRGGVPVSFGSTVTGLGYAPTVGARVRTEVNSSGELQTIKGEPFTSSNLGIVTATYNNITGIVTIETFNEHKFKNSNESVILQSLQFDPALSLSGTEFPIVSIAATNVFGANIGKNTTTHNYVGGGTVKPKFSNLTFGSGYNGLVSIAVTVKDFGYEHRFVSADVNGIDKNSGGDITATDAEYDPTTGIMIVTSPNHGMNNGDLVIIKEASIRFTCSRDDFKTVHGYPRTTDPAYNTNKSITKITDDIFSLDVGVNVGSGAQVSAVAGAGGTAIFTIDSVGSNYQDPEIFVSEPSYSNLSVSGVSRLGIGTTTDTGSNLKVNVIVSASSTTGIGSTLFGASRYEIVDSGYGFKKGDVIEAVGLVTSKGMGSVSPKSTLSVDEIYTDSFAMWQFGEFDYIDSIKSLQNGVRTKFPLKLNNELISVEASASLLSSVNIENIFLVTVNGIVQEPNKSYTIIGGTSINFTDAPTGDTSPDQNDGDDISILFYKGTGGDDSEVVEGQKTIIKTGDEVRIESTIDSLGNKVETQDNRTVTGINTSTTLETNVYQGQGISETISRPLTLIRQKVDKTINKVFFSKKRSELEPRIIPTSKIIGKNISSSDTFFFVDNADYFNYENESTPRFQVELISNKPTVGASVTAIVSNTGTVSSYSIVNPGLGYPSAPNIKVSAPVGGGTTATGNTVIGAGGTVILTSPITFGSGYTSTNPPQCIIPKPPIVHEKLTSDPTNGVDILESTGIVTGISTTMFEGDLCIEFTIKRSGANFNPIGADNPIYIFDTQIGTGVTSLTNGGNNNNIVGVGTTFLDNVYEVASFSSNGDVGIATCCIDSNTVTTGLSAVGYSTAPIGKYSVGKISGFIRSSSPISVVVKGLIVDSGLSTFPTLKRTGGSDTLSNTGGLITPS